MTDLERYRDYEIDHEPDGWPAIQMKDVTALVDEIEQQRARVKELESEKATLVEALEPFAKCARELDGSPEDGIDPADDDEWAKFRLLVSDYRRARAALAAYRKGG